MYDIFSVRASTHKYLPAQCGFTGQGVFTSVTPVFSWSAEDAVGAVVDAATNGGLATRFLRRDCTLGRVINQTTLVGAAGRR